MKSRIVKRLQLNAKFSDGFKAVEVSIKDMDTGEVQICTIPIQLNAKPEPVQEEEVQVSEVQEVSTND